MVFRHRVLGGRAKDLEVVTTFILMVKFREGRLLLEVDDFHVSHCTYSCAAVGRAERTGAGVPRERDFHHGDRFLAWGCGCARAELGSVNKVLCLGHIVCC